MLAILCLAARMLHARGGAPLVAPLCDEWVPTLASHADSSAVTEALFDLAFHAQPCYSAASLSCLMERCAGEMRSSSEASRLAAIKLLGVALSSSAEKAAPATETIEPLLRMLHALGRDDPSQSVRALAQQLAYTAIGGASAGA